MKVTEVKCVHETVTKGIEALTMRKAFQTKVAGNNMDSANVTSSQHDDVAKFKDIDHVRNSCSREGK